MSFYDTYDVYTKNFNTKKRKPQTEKENKKSCLEKSTKNNHGWVVVSGVYTHKKKTK